MSVVESKPKSHLIVPASLRLLVSPGIRGHSLIFSLMMTLLFATTYIGRLLGFAGTWTIVFILGASTGGTYLVLALFTLMERTKQVLFHSRLKTRMFILAFLYVPIVAGLSYWINQAGSVEALPIFPVFLTIFYGWIFLQAFFIATPISHLLNKLEKILAGNGARVKSTKTLGGLFLFSPIVPLVYAVWEISSWLNTTYQNVQGSSATIIGWTLTVTVILLFTYAIALQWGWRALKGDSPQAAIYLGGVFFLLWGYLLYRATSVAIGFISQNQPSSLLADSTLVAISILGAMQTLAGKTINRTGERLSQLLPFLVFSFGAVYTVAEFYFLLQAAVTRPQLSVGVNATVFATGVIILILFLRRRVQREAELGVDLAVEPEAALTDDVHPETTPRPDGPKRNRWMRSFSSLILFPKPKEEQDEASGEAANS